MTLYIKNMVCNRCKMVVRTELEKLGHRAVDVELGEVKLDREINDTEKHQIAKTLQAFGFTLINDKKSRIIEKIKNTIVELVHNRDNELKVKLSAYLADEMGHDYTYISNLFSEVEGVTVEKYYIAQKIERVKELLVYDELSLSEIAHKLNYSGVGYLSSQFKKITGFTPSHFKQVKEKKRNSLDEV